MLKILTKTLSKKTYKCKYMKNTPHQTSEKCFIKLMNVYRAPLASLYSTMRL